MPFSPSNKMVTGDEIIVFASTKTITHDYRYGFSLARKTSKSSLKGHYPKLRQHVIRNYANVDAKLV